MSDEQDLLSGLALSVFRLNGQFLAVAEDIARPVGLTATWWQVLGAVLGEPLTVAAIAREMGITRQSVLRVANRLVDEGLAEYQPNPAHRRARLLRPTEDGYAAVRRIDPAHAAVAARLADRMPVADLRRALTALEELSVALASLEASA